MTINIKLLIILITSLLALLSVLIGVFFSWQNFLYASIFFLALTLFFSIYLYLFKQKNKNEIEFLRAQLESKVNEIQNVNKQIKIQEEEIIHQIRFLKEQGKQIQIQKKEIENNIKYASKIQQAILPQTYFADRLLNDYFVFYLPKNTAGGDLYYIEQVNDYIVIAVADCTGHGTHGAIMSFLTYTLLNKAVKLNYLTKPSEIIEFINKELSYLIKSEKKYEEIDDRLSISIISIHNFHKLVEFAGADNFMYYIHKGKIHEVSGDRMFIGNHPFNETYSFTNQAIPVFKGDMIYLFTDGYANQFGGTNNKKFKYNQLKNLLWEIYDLPADEQKDILSNTFYKWKANNEQVDDVLVMGIRI